VEFQSFTRFEELLLRLANYSFIKALSQHFSKNVKIWIYILVANWILKHGLDEIDSQSDELGMENPVFPVLEKIKLVSCKE
jgi:hypothetical protein